MYPLPESVHPRLVLKGIPFNVPEEDLRAELAAHDVQVTHISQLTETDKSTRTVITEHPLFIIFLLPGSDICKVLQILKHCHLHCQMGEIKKLPPSASVLQLSSFRPLIKILW